MKSALEIFRVSLDRVRSIHLLYINFSASVTSIIYLSDLLRDEIVLIVSAFDQFIHELTRLGMMEIWRKQRLPTDAHLKFSISLSSTTQLSVPGGADVYLETEIRSRHSYLTFQHPDKIADAIRLFSAVDLWKCVGGELGQKPEVVRSQLKVLVERRNKIAHEADIDPSYPGQRWPISRHDAEGALAFVERLGEAIFKIVA